MSNASRIAISSFCVVALGLITGCEVLFGPVLVGSGVVISEARESEPFTGVEISGAIDATVTIGDTPWVEISGDDNIVPLVITEVRDGTLVVRTDHRGRLKLSSDITVTIVTPELDRADVSGACDVDIEGLNTDKITVDVSGASDLAITGNCRELVAGLSGACELEAGELQAVEVRVDASGASDATVRATERLVADASGASTIKYSGNPASVQADKSGASSVRAISDSNSQDTL